MVTLGAQLLERAARTPGGTFLADLTYEDACRRMFGTAARLEELGVRPGDRVAVTMDNSPELAVLLYACSLVGAVLAPFDRRLTVHELAPLVARLDPALVVPSAGIGAVDPSATPRHVAKGSGRAPLVIVHSSGSTGGPKGCVLTNDSLLVPARAMVERLALTSDDVLLNLLPLHHMAGLSFLVTGAAAGATTALRGSFRGSRFWADVRDTGATVFRHIGEMLAVLCQQPADPGERDHRLRLVYGGGAKATVAEQFSARFGVPTIEGYGLSETNTVLAGSTIRSLPGTLGQPLPHLQVRIVDASGTAVDVGEGELQVATNPALMLGYFGAPDLTERAMQGSWFRTGDLVRRDAAGNIRFVRRMSDIIRRRGENIDPAEIEQAAVACPGVKRAAAVGVPDAAGRVDIRLFVEPEAGRPVLGADVARHLTDLLAPFKIPREVVVGAIPRTATEKIDKPALLRLCGVPA